MFEHMWTLGIAKLIYVIGVIAIIVVSVLLVEEVPLFGVLLLIAGNLLWRLIIEGIVLIFSIHERLTEILKELRNSNTEEEQQKNNNEDWLNRYPEPGEK